MYIYSLTKDIYAYTLTLSRMLYICCYNTTQTAHM